MDTWQSVLLAVGAMAAFALAVTGAVLAAMLFRHGDIGAIFRSRRR